VVNERLASSIWRRCEGLGADADLGAGGAQIVRFYFGAERRKNLTRLHSKSFWFVAVVVHG
jgi:hypothetical protein